MAEPDEPQKDDAAPPEDEAATEAGTHRKLFETALHALTIDERVKRAATAQEPELSAFCFDPVPAVVKAILENPLSGPIHARLIARHHRNPVGLEAIAARFAADGEVRRWLVRNPQVPAALIRRLFMSRRLPEQYQLSLSRDLPEASRRIVRDMVRARFSQVSAEERVELIVMTEGRALTMLTGIGVDGRTIALLCARPIRSSLFIQNIARWGAAPPQLIAHLLKQEMVRAQPTLRTMLQRHPNAPSTASYRKP